MMLAVEMGDVVTVVMDCIRPPQPSGWDFSIRWSLAEGKIVQESMLAFSETKKVQVIIFYKCMQNGAFVIERTSVEQDELQTGCCFLIGGEDLASGWRLAVFRCCLLRK